MLNVKEAAAHATVSEGLIRKWIEDGLPHFRFGAKGKRGKIMIELEDLDAWMAGFKVQINSPPPKRHVPLKHLKL